MPKPVDILRYRLALAVIVVLGIVLTAWLARRTSANARNRNDLRFQHTVTQLTQAISGRVDVYIALLRGTRAFLADPAQRNPERFRAFVTQLNFSRNYPGCQGIGFAQRVTPQDQPGVLAEARGQGRVDFRIWPELAGPVGFPIVLLEPENERNRAALGFDMFSEPTRHAAMLRAGQTGAPAASGRVTLVQEIDQDKQAGFLIYLPLYEGARHWDNLVGFVYGPFRADDLFRGIFGNQAVPGIHFAVYDGDTVAPEHLLHASGGAPGSEQTAWSTRRQMEVAGRLWTVEFTAGPDWSEGQDAAGWSVLIGAVVTLLVLLLLRTIEHERVHTRRQARALAASEQRAKENEQRAKENEQRAKENEQRKQAIFDAALDGIITVDGAGRIAEFNPAAETIFGRRRDEAIGRWFVEVVFPERLHELYRRGAERQLATGARELVGRRLELRGARADGTEFPLELTIGRIELRDEPVFTAFVRDITDRREAEAQIRELNDTLERRVQQRTAQLEDANRQLESFSYSVSHDLRAPARHVLGFAQLLKRQLTNCDNPEAARLVRVISDSAGRMAKLIDDLLAFSRTSRQELRRTRVPMRQLVDETINALAPEIGSRRVEWRIEPLPDVEGDHTLLALVWSNLLSNAVKYTRGRDPTIIVIRAEPKDAETVFSVQDNGTGFDLRYAGKLFGVFVRLHREEEFEGTGIGLANVARIVQRHGGRVWADSRPGEGATFSFALPQRPPPAPPPSATRPGFAGRASATPMRPPA